VVALSIEELNGDFAQPERVNEYDDFGNRTSQNVTKGLGYSHEARHDPVTNWMLDDSTDYDANGNIVLLPNLHMNYDSQNRLVRVDGINGSSFSFYHGTRNLATYTLATDASGNLSFRVVKTNIYFGKRLAQSGGDVVVADRLGSTRAWSAKKGAKTASYTPFGEKVDIAEVRAIHAAVIRIIVGVRHSTRFVIATILPSIRSRIIQDVGFSSHWVPFPLISLPCSSLC
jgi:hypothetical protein